METPPNIGNRQTLVVPPDYYDQADSDNACFLCGNPRFTELYTVRHYGFPFTFKRCACGLVKQTPMPNERFFEWFFNADVFFSSKDSHNNEIWGYHDYFSDEPSRLLTSRRRYEELRRYFEAGRPLRVMKIGPSTGTMLHVLKEHGHSVRGCDVSSRFAEYARKTYAVEIDNGRFERMGYPDESFDVVLLFNVIENVPNLVEFLEAIRRTLKPGGLFISNVVDMRRNIMAVVQGSTYFLYRPPVCYIFTMPVYRQVLDRFGFRAEGVYRDHRYLTPAKIATLLRWKWMLRSAEFLGIEGRPFPVYAYPSKIIVAVKTA